VVCAQTLALLASLTRLRSLCGMDVASAQQSLLRAGTVLRACINVLGCLREPSAEPHSSSSALLAASFSSERDLLALAIAEVLSWEVEGLGTFSVGEVVVVSPSCACCVLALIRLGTCACHLSRLAGSICIVTC
jgi:hypothetical protein